MQLVPVLTAHVAEVAKFCPHVNVLELCLLCLEFFASGSSNPSSAETQRFRLQRRCPSGGGGDVTSQYSGAQSELHVLIYSGINGEGLPGTVYALPAFSGALQQAVGRGLDSRGSGAVPPILCPPV